jgi:hypothetical protein
VISSPSCNPYENEGCGEGRNNRGERRKDKDKRVRRRDDFMGSLFLIDNWL